MENISRATAQSGTTELHIPYPAVSEHPLHEMVIGHMNQLSIIGNQAEFKHLAIRAAADGKLKMLASRGWSAYSDVAAL